ncbi:MAG TPA: 3-mercaptopyruvate sulfurtransferase, partial [Azospirillaceae bacterium]|nr:3-mercaptopyruvate sulfurtransferase [Azospirillaceae bacterium]
DVHVVDATWVMKGSPRNPRAEYEACHIPGAVFFDIDEIADTSTSLPHMLPPPEKFSSRARSLGLGAGTRIVIYDADGVSSAACRVWWMFRAFGHKDVAVLDGGLAKWKAEGRPVSDLPPVPRQRHFSSHTNHFLVRDTDQVLANIDSRREQVVDARATERFEGTVDEPWPNRRRGHIPGALSVPFKWLLDDNQCFLPAEHIKAKFETAGVDLHKPITVSCGSGVTACVLAMSLYLLGREDVAVYDGSWAEWGLRDDLPVELGSAKIAA